MDELRFRQVHLDFHTSPDIGGVGDRFDAEEFAQTLVDAHVDSITCFAKCHHGMLYYKTEKFADRVHPKLKNHDLLREQIDECHKRGIRVPVYVSVQWDHLAATEHPEWLAINGDGATIGPEEEGGVQRPCASGFYYTLCLNSPYRDLLKAQVEDILTELSPVDGLFFDIVIPVPCACNHCKAEMVKQGFKPHIEADRLAYSRILMDEFEADMTRFIRQFNKECGIFYNSSHIGTGHRKSQSAYTHFELESLPSGPWGYLDFPITMRYARNLGLDCLSHTGKFHTCWGDFHSFKNRAALEFECFHMLALNAKCLIGDQLEPNGKLSQPVYDLIGSVYSEVERKEPWCAAAKAVTDIGVFTPEEFFSVSIGALPPSLQGVSRMLQESGHQFDVIDSKSDLSAYRLLILPDTIPVEPAFREKISRFINDGGALIASYKSGLNSKETAFELKELGVEKSEQVTCDPNGIPVSGKMFLRNDYSDYILPQDAIGKGLPHTEHIMYMKGLEVEACPESEILSNSVQSYFNRNYEHFCSHRQTPSSGQKGYPAIVKKQNAIYFAHPIFLQYFENAPHWCKQMFLNAVDMLLPEPVLRHNGPSTMLATVNAQQTENRWVVHLLHYIPERRCREIDIIEDVIPLYNVTVSLLVPGGVKSVESVPECKSLAFEVRSNRLEFTVPQINGHQMISVNFK
jgi:hypothetical protein